MLRQREQRLFLEPGVALPLEDVAQHVHRALVAHLRQPEHRLLPHLGVGVALGDLEQQVGRLGRLLLRDQEHRLLAQHLAALVAAGDDPGQDRHRPLGVHLQERVERGNALVVFIFDAVTGVTDATRARSAGGAGLVGRGRRGRGGGHVLRAVRVALLGELAANPRAQRTGIACRGARMLRLQFVQRCQRAIHVAGVAAAVERECLQVHRLAEARRLGKAGTDAAKEFDRAAIVTLGEGVVGESHERVGGIGVARACSRLDQRTEGAERRDLGDADTGR